MARRSEGMQKLQQLRKKLIFETKERVREAYTSRDIVVVQSVNAIDELAAITNTMTMRLKEWHSIYFPELARQIVQQEEYAKAVQALTSREKPDVGALSAAIGDKQAAKVVELAGKSMGAPLEEADLASIKEYAAAIQKLQKEESRLESYMEKLMREIAPNLSAVAGPKLGAKLIAHAGSLEKLAFLPSSTVQIMGAEKALFKHLKQGKKPPKHGLIFQHSAISTGRQKLRGKIARVLAAKITIAAREDFFSKGKKDNSKDLLADFNRKVEAFKKQA